MAQDLDKASSTISAKSVAKYALLPGILPRLQRMAMNLSHFLFMFTQIFGAVGLIDRNHPCLKAENIGRYRFSDVIGLAASNVVFDRKHIPQIVMFFAVIGSIVLTVAIFLGLVASTLMTVSTAQAQLFGTPEGISGVQYAGVGNDWAMNFLYRIFGETGIIAKPQSGIVGNPWFTRILVSMLKYYSLAMLVVAAFMILYILIITLTESAKTGQPFGSRFDGVWAPVRIALAIGLLMPVMTSGYNGAQMITFQAAVWGSNLATNVWYGGLSSVKDSRRFFSAMMADPGYRFVRDAFLINLCVSGLKAQAGNDTWNAGKMMYTRTESGGYVFYTFGPEDAPDFCGQAKFLAKPGADKPDGIKDSSWPEKVAESYLAIAYDFLPVPKYVKPAVTPTGPMNSPSTTSAGYVSGEVTTSKQMDAVVQAAATDLLGNGKDISEMKYFMETMSKKFNGSVEIEKWMKAYWAHMGVVSYNNCGGKDCGGRQKRGLYFESPTYKQSIDEYNTWIYDRMTKDAQYGWTTAGVFYLRISAAFASISEVVNNPPVVTKLPANFSKIFATVVNPTANIEGVNAECSKGWNDFLQFFGATSECMQKYELAKNVNRFLRGGKDWFFQSVKVNPSTYELMDTENFDRALDIAEADSPTNTKVSTITGPVLDGLAGMAQIDSNSLNPLGVVIQWGNLLMTLAFIAYGIGLAGTGLAWSDLAFSLGAILMIPGFVLAFWVPTLPFMHFTFAVIEWMISILEAVIGMPLWALSLITLQGDGLGQLGMSGVKRLFEIVLRPTIIVMSLVASVIIFTSGVSFFNSAIGVYDEARDAQGGFFTGLVAGPGMVFLYVFAIYTLATSCFKLIDSIPDKFGRWMGLDGGFGSQIKTGMNDLTGLIVGGAAFKGMQEFGTNAGKAGKARRERKAKDALKKANGP